MLATALSFLAVFPSSLNRSSSLNLERLSRSSRLAQSGISALERLSFRRRTFHEPNLMHKLLLYHASYTLRCLILPMLFSGGGIRIHDRRRTKKRVVVFPATLPTLRWKTAYYVFHLGMFFFYYRGHQVKWPERRILARYLSRIRKLCRIRESRLTKKVNKVIMECKNKSYFYLSLHHDS